CCICPRCLPSRLGFLIRNECLVSHTIGGVPVIWHDQDTGLASMDNALEPQRAAADTSRRDHHLFAPGPKRVLALDGGGVRGAITVAFLERIEELLKQR